MRCSHYPSLLGALVCAIGATLCSCDAYPHLTAPRLTVPHPTADIFDGAHSGGNPHVFFLPPAVAQPSFSGTFDPTLSPEVEICEYDSQTGCSAVIADYTATTGPGSETVRLDQSDQLYIVNWKTSEFTLADDRIYRIIIRVAGYTVGSADVEVMDNAQNLKNVDTQQYIALTDDRTLPIKFRLEQGMVVSLSISPNPGTVTVGGTLPMTATLVDAHGNVVPDQIVTWSTSDAGIAQVSTTSAQTANVLGVAPGSATVTATSGSASATSLVNVVGHGLPGLSVGAGFACALTQMGAAYCWGGNNAGQLGNGTENFSSLPVPVASGRRFVSIGAGGYHACAVEGGSGTAYCWGDNLNLTPVAIAGNVAFASVTAGFAYTCGLDVTGVAYCWGQNVDGQLGAGQGPDSPNAPVRVATSEKFVSLSAGASAFTCGVTKSGATLCWGYNGEDELGAPTTELCGGVAPCSSTPIAVTSNPGFVAVSAGSFSACGLTLAGAVYCWGKNYWGELGPNVPLASSIDLGETTTPAAVSNALTFATVLAAGERSCALQKGTGAAFCWGYNGFYDPGPTLGIGPTGPTTVNPTPVLGPHNVFVQLAGYGSICAVDRMNAIYCWGENESGQLGNGTTQDAYVPTRVGAPF